MAELKQCVNLSEIAFAAESALIKLYLEAMFQFHNFLASTQIWFP
jgi:hypothetical protein